MAESTLRINRFDPARDGRLAGGKRMLLDRIEWVIMDPATAGAGPVRIRVGFEEGAWFIEAVGVAFADELAGVLRHAARARMIAARRKRQRGAAEGEHFHGVVAGRDQADRLQRKLGR